MSLKDLAKEVCDLARADGNVDLLEKAAKLMVAVTDLHYENFQLKEKLMKQDAWDEQKKRYKLTTPWKGDSAAVVYAVKESYKETETAHWACPKCYDDGRRSILQPNKAGEFIWLICATCNTKISTSFRSINAAEYVAD